MKVHLDFETRSEVDLKVHGLNRYARGKQTDIMCAAFSFDEGPIELWKLGDPAPMDLLIHVHEGGEVVAHNAPFELEIWNVVGVRKYGWPVLKPQQTFCNMAQAYAMALPGALANVAPALGMDLQKDDEGNRIMLQLSKPKGFNPDGSAFFHEPWHSPEIAAKFERMYSYCMKDVEVERESGKRMMELTPTERALWLLDYKINQRGIHIDVKAVEVAMHIVEIEKKRLDQKMVEVTNNCVGTCTANSQLTEWLNFRGIETDSVAKEKVIQMLQRDDLPGDVRAALLLRQEAAKSSTAKLKQMRDKVCNDNRIRNTSQYHGAATGRWAGRGLQTQNFPRPNMKQENIEEVFKIFEGVYATV
jgi:DNA polymerase